MLVALDVSYILHDPVFVVGHIREDTRRAIVGTLVAETGKANQEPFTIVCLPHEGPATVTLYAERKQEKW